MLSRAYIRTHPDAVRQAIHDKQVDLDLDELLMLDQRVRELETQQRELQEQRNKLSKAFASVSPEQREALAAQSRAVSKGIEDLKPQRDMAEQRLQELLWLVPNIPIPTAPRGAGDEANVVIRTWGEPPAFDFDPKDHVEILERHHWAEFERVAKVAGSRAYALRGEVARLELALHLLTIDKLTAAGFTLVTLPALTREHGLYGTGHFPTGRDEAYRIPKDDLYLSGTAEVALTGLHGGEILNEADLPLLYAGYAPCFRREAGSFGRDVRGLLRVHQFSKIEQYVICRNDVDESARWHARLLQLSEEILQDLALPYQVMEICTGDMGPGKYRMNDLEVWVPSLGRYRETHSCSTLLDWQARRANLRYRDREGTVQHVHTLNNTGIATPRILVPLLEVHQAEDGTVRIPKALQPYMGDRQTLGCALR